jgi:hypothetical protein
MHERVEFRNTFQGTAYLGEGRRYSAVRRVACCKKSSNDDTPNAVH